MLPPLCNVVLRRDSSTAPNAEKDVMRIFCGRIEKSLPENLRWIALPAQVHILTRIRITPVLSRTEGLISFRSRYGPAIELLHRPECASRLSLHSVSEMD